MNTTLLIGLDGATFTILQPLMTEGHMPFLKKIMENGIQAPLLSTPNPLTPPAWTSIATGRSPGNHGIYDFVRGEEREGTFYFTLNNASDIQCETIWSIASRNGCKVSHLNFPITAPPEPINGIAIPSMVQWRHIRKNVYPQSLFETMKAIPGFNSKDWGLTYCEANEAMRLRAQNPQEEKEWVYRNIKRDFQWFTLFSWFMKNQRSDLNAIVFDGVDKLQHLCWHLIDPASLPEEMEEWEVKMREYVLKYFQGIDSYLEKISDLAGPKANIFIVSDHGFGPTRYVFHVNVLLEKMGYLKWLDVKDQKGRETNHEWSFASLDWNETSAYVGTPSSNGVLLRAPGQPGENTLNKEEYTDLKARVTRDLLAFRDQVTGEQIVVQVTDREHAFPGTAMEEAPDLLLTLSDHSFVSVVREEPIVLSRPKVNGTHRPEGVFLGTGPAIQKGLSLKKLSILDVAPTLLYSLGLDIPDDFEGRVVEECFRQEYLDERPVKYIKAEKYRQKGSSSSDKKHYSQEEEDVIFSQLQALGYME